MVKCRNSECKKAAYYGTVYLQPLYCKDHKSERDISVKNKCTHEGCINAYAGKVPLCSRCFEVHISVEEFSKMKIGELKTIIARENGEQDGGPKLPPRPLTPGAPKKRGRNPKLYLKCTD